MKTLIALCLCLVCSCLDSHAQTQPADIAARKSMAHVIGQRFGAIWGTSDLQLSHGQVKHFRIYFRDTLPRLKAIETQGCPDKFRLAWFDYLAAWETSVQKKAPLTQYIDQPQIIPTSIALPADVNAMVNQGDFPDTRELWLKVERAALEYGFDTSKLKF